MDKKNFLIGILLLFTAFSVLFYQSYQQHQRLLEEQRQIREAEEQAPREATPEESSTPPAVEPGVGDHTPEISPDADESARAPRSVPAEVPPPADFAEFVTEERDDDHIIENEYMRITFTRRGGSIRHVAMVERDDAGSLVYPREIHSDEPFVFNRHGFAPPLALLGLDFADPRHLYEVIPQSVTDRSVTFRLRVTENLEIRRSYVLLEAEGRRDPNAYTIRHQTRFYNRGENYYPIEVFGLNLGTSGPASERDTGMHLNFAHYDGGRGASFTGTHKFRGGGFFNAIGVRNNPPRAEIRGEQPLIWTAVKNQFFTGLLTPEDPGVGFVTRPFTLPPRENSRATRIGITGEMLFDVRGVQPGGQVDLTVEYFVGPKEFRRLEQMDQRQDLIMQFGFVGFFSKILLMMMIGIQGLPLVGYGLAIVITTIIIKTILWPLTAKVSRSSKRMAKIAEPMKALREKYKDNPQKMQMETMRLFRENKVNPFAGCLPIFIQLPIFFALFRMLQSAAELRFESFLWVQDLSAPDTVATILGIPLNPMPILMGVTMFIQMKMMPMTTANPMQQKVFLFMPPVITLVLYNFSSGLCLYWTVNNLLTILQQFLINRQKDDDFEVVIPSDAPAKGSGAKKAVRPTGGKTPGKKKRN